LFGYSKQAYYQYLKRELKKGVKAQIILAFIAIIRQHQPKAGLCKVWRMYERDLPENLQVGREQFLDIGRENGLIIREKAFSPRTTNSNHRFRKYKNTIKDLEIIRPEQVWASDITYLPIADRFGYLSLITDLYSKKIVGWSVQDNLSRKGPIAALNMAFDSRKYPSSELIHHSDRGVQYCCEDYIKLLTKPAITISMTENGDPYENAIAERVNGILKQEFNLANGFPDMTQAEEAIRQAINIYNLERIHMSNGFITPEAMHGQDKIKLKKWPWKKHKFKPGQEEETSNAAVQLDSSNVPTMMETEAVITKAASCL
jgi:hypothetical protein